MAYDFRLLNSEGFGEVVDADGGVLHVGAVGWGVGVSDAGEVRGDDGEALGEEGNDGLPHLRGFGEAVQEDQIWAVAGCEVVQFGSIDSCGAGVDGLPGGCRGKEEWAEDGQS